MGRRTTILALLLTFLAVAVVAFRLGTAGGRQDDAGESGTFRWSNTEVTVPQHSEPVLHVRRILPPAAGHAYLLEVVAYRDEDGRDRPKLQIDADRGDVLVDTLSAVLPGVSDEIVGSIVITSNEPKVWPYLDEEVTPLNGADAAQTWGNLRFVEPDPSSGIVVAPSTGTCLVREDAPACETQTLAVYNARSFVHISATTGQFSSTERLHPSDEEAFQRYADSLVVVSAQSE